ncbi:MAG: aminotransferase class V-fold PLP-dependent enzyme [Sphingobium sp.]|nr:aminotransferase class V-fold PLP-dependent enzyme [Sphingobium sp.]MBP6111164.1 aminotransferase class V-fold PLP-dependent enzyme [Sphingobium sp.]MBP8669746.1 aminotransferase class V-fold PLP-dependent enzyme [Sphingobium sp.]MBP9156494.1 aminotransferase class V-fold PLP-dependent enzyme [Sphingobium sp.]MCC6482693.1 aminotransferase class V-fold PLP-dependent enzyme [Sphingomonadaceae bacterium]
MSRSVPDGLISAPATRIYLDHAATTPLCDAARAAMTEGMARWANPSSPHAEGRAARAALEDARARIKAALGWDGEVIFTSGASEAIAIPLGRNTAARCVVSPVEHDAVLRVAGDGAERLAVDAQGRVAEVREGALHAIQHVNNETGVIQPIAELAERIHAAAGWLLCDCAQSAGKIDLPTGPDMIAVSAHKFGGPPGVGALLVRDLGLLRPTGGQEQGYRGGTENLPGVLAMAAALSQERGWMREAARLRDMLDTAIAAAGGVVVAAMAERIPTIASYHMPGVSARAQLIRLDTAGIAVSAGAACSSGTLKTSPVLRALGWEAATADEVIRVSFGPQTRETDIHAFLEAWRGMAQAKAA